AGTAMSGLVVLAVTLVSRLVRGFESFGLPKGSNVYDMYTYPLFAKSGWKARPQNPRSSNVLTFALRSMKGVGRSTPCLMTLTTPFFCHTNRRPSGAHASPTTVKGGKVATTSDTNPGSLKVWAAPSPPARRNT